MTLADESDWSHSATADAPPSPPFAQPAPIVKYTSDGTIDEDIFCLDCGYNLRGLRGDPVRCPECGGDNDLASVILPAVLICTALRDLETCPTVCVALTLAFVLCATIAAAISLLAVAGAAVFVGVGMIFWIGTYRRFAETIDDPAAARDIVVRFHVATLLCTAPAFAFFFLGWLLRDQNMDLFGQLAIVIAAAEIIGLTLGLSMYFRVRADKIGIQRAVAVSIARERIRHVLKKRRGKYHPHRRLDEMAG